MKHNKPLPKLISWTQSWQSDQYFSDNWCSGFNESCISKMFRFTFSSYCWKKNSNKYGHWG